MTGDMDALAHGIAHRLWTRIAARDRLEALDENATGATLAGRAAAQPELLDTLVAEGLDEVLAALAASSRRAQLRALCRDGAQGDVDVELVRSGLAQSSWTGEEVGPSAAGEAASRLLDALTEQVTAALRERLQARHRVG